MACPTAREFPSKAFEGIPPSGMHGEACKRIEHPGRLYRVGGLVATRVQDFESFYRENFRRVLRATSLTVGSVQEAYDITQEAFARTWAAWSRVGESDRALGFTLKVAANLSMSHLRRLIRHRRILPFLAERNESEGVSTRADTSLAVRSAVAALPPRQRWAVTLCHLLGYPVDEAASMEATAWLRDPKEGQTG
jgi:RNA polymerase sigma-70 factor (ECF subfamily)